MEIKIVEGKKYTDISNLKGWDLNPRSITEKGFERLKKQIKRLGQHTPLIIKEDGTVMSGNMRLKAMLDMGLKDIWVELIPKDKEQLAIDYALSANDRVGKYEGDQLANLIGNFPEVEWGDYSVDIKEPELVSDLMESFKEVEEDEAPAVEMGPAESKLGEVYQLGRHRVMCGDSTKIEDVEKLMDGKKAELLFTSPPYSDIREYGGGKDLSVDNLAQFISVFSSFCSYQAVNLGIKRQDHEIVQYWDEYIKIAKDNGLKLMAWNVWAKQNAGSVGNQSSFIPISHEWIFVFGTQFKDINRAEKRKTDIKQGKQGRTVRQKDGTMKWSTFGEQEQFKEMESVFYQVAEMGNIRKEHPATFPVGLPIAYIKAITDRDDTVVDPFLGSGSTLIACEQTNRTCYGMELDPHYVDVIRKRYDNFINNRKLTAK